MKKQVIALVEFKGKHRVRFEAVVEFTPYPRCVVFAEIHENHKQDKVIRMMLNLNDMWQLTTRATKIIEDGAQLADGTKIILKESQVTQSDARYTKLFYGIHKKAFSTFMYYLNFTHGKNKDEKETLNISFTQTEFEAYLMSLKHFSNYAQKRFYGLYEAQYMENSHASNTQ